ncbi:MAG: hypothetical protein U0165_06725 [Polyangiaceae bacterium]
MSMWIRACGLLMVASTTMGCSLFTADIPRKVHGRIVKGPPVAPEAYAAYLEGVTAEATGHFDVALSWFERAADEDSTSGDVWARIGAVQCQMGRSPEAAFARAAREEPDLATVWLERSICHLQQGRLDEAFRESRHALELDPASSAVGLQVALVLEKRSALDDAQRWLEGLVARDENNERLLQALLRVATARHDERTTRRIQRALDERNAQRVTEPASPVEDSSHPRRVDDRWIDEAILRDDTKTAQRLAGLKRMRLPELSKRAYELGKLKFALEQSTVALGAEPSNTTALLVALVSADLLGDERRFRWALRTGAPAIAHGARAPEDLRDAWEKLLQRRSRLEVE